jgi:hypothetical protein
MPFDWKAILQSLGSTAILMAALVWLSKAILTHLFSRDIENQKASMKAQYDLELENSKVNLKALADTELEKIKANLASEFAATTHKYELELEKMRVQLDSSVSRKERIRAEIVLWANPILRSVLDLARRLDNIVGGQSYAALNRNYVGNNYPGWSISYEYFMESSIYLFGQYFCWITLLQERLNFELFQTQDEKDRFFSVIREVERALGAFPPPFDCSGEDIQVLVLQQRSIGEAFIFRENGAERCLRYYEFLQRLNDPIFANQVLPLRALLEGIDRTDGSCRWKRLVAALDALVELRKCCMDILQLEQQP